MAEKAGQSIQNHQAVQLLPVAVRLLFFVLCDSMAMFFGGSRNETPLLLQMQNAGYR
jgi:hypothetical protein